jgi:hypothetical protein
MCRSIKRLREGADVVADEQIREAALQYVRKVSGFSKPTARHQDAFDRAVDQIARSSKELLDAVARELT